MSPFRLAVAAIASAALIVLATWQLRREQTVKACLDSGGIWHGPASACKHPLRPILRRDLERS